MKTKKFLPPFGKIFIIALFLSIIGGSGLLFTLLFLEPRLGPRWLFFFFLVIFGAGAALPLTFVIQRRFANQVVQSNILIREASLFGIYLALLAWLQLGRVLNNLIVVIIGIGFLLFEMLLRMAEKATFKADENEET